MAPHTCRSGLVLALAMAAFIAGPLGNGRAQSLTDGMDALNKKIREHRALMQQLLKGQAQADPSDKTQVEAIDVYARYNTYRVYLDHLEGQPTKIDRAFKDFEGDIDAINRNKPATQPLSDLFREKVRLHALEVIQYDNAKPIHKIYNARVLAKIAELGEGKLAASLCELLKDDKKAKDDTKKGGINDGVRYYALRGLRTLFALSPRQMPPLVPKDEEEKCAEAIVDLIERKPDLPKHAPQDEVDGYRLLRREAVRALAEIHVPSFNDKVRPALALARIAGDDEGVLPPPRLDERIEAAIGLARMTAAQGKNYDPEYAAGQIAKSIGKLAQQVSAEKEIRERSHPWRTLSVRLIEALAALKTDSGKNAYVAEVANRGTNLLQRIADAKSLPEGDVTWFNTPQSDPPSKELFKGAANSAVKPANRETSEK